MRHLLLYVDDERPCLSTFARLLKDVPDLEVHVASSAGEARALIAQNDYAVVVADQCMPEETGIDLFASLDAANAGPVLVLTSGYADLPMALEALNRGHLYALLEKPWRRQEVALTVRQAVERHELGRALHEKIVELERANEALARRNRELSDARFELERLYDMASTDAKTGVRSYRYFRSRLEEEVMRSQRYGMPLGLMLIDLDGFKAVNDRFGHVAGDAILRDIAQLMRGAIRAMDVLARYGGDEFAVILPNTNISGAAKLGDRLLARVGDACFTPAQAGAVTVSMGLTAIPDHPVKAAEQLIGLADTALYLAKSRGRNRFEVAGAA